MGWIDDAISGVSKALSGGDFWTGLVGGGLKMMANQDQNQFARESAAEQARVQGMYQAQAEDFNAQQAQLAYQRNYAGQLQAQDFSASQADIARQFSARQQSQAEAFNASQAELNRNFQERMSSTAYQRSRADMAAAGLNPILAAGAGGSSTPGGGQGAIGAVSGPAASSGGASGPGASIGTPSAPLMDRRVGLLEGVISSAAEAARLQPSIDAIRQQTRVGEQEERVKQKTGEFIGAQTATEVERRRQIEKQTKLMGGDVSALGVSGNVEGIVELVQKYLAPGSRSPGLGAGSRSSAQESSSSASSFDRFLFGGDSRIKNFLFGR